MVNKKKLIGYIVLLCLAIAVIVVCLTVPMIRVMMNPDAEIPGSVPTINGDYTLFGLFNADLVYEGAFDTVWFNADGPLWLVFAGIAFNIILLLGCVAVIIMSIVGIVRVATNNTKFNTDKATRNLGLFTGIFGVSIITMCLVGFNVCNLTSRGYMTSYNLYAQYINFVLCIAMVVFATFVNKKSEQPIESKTKNIIWYSVISALSIAMSVFMSLIKFTEGYGLFTQTFVEGMQDMTMFSGPIHTLTVVSYGLTLMCITFLGIYSLIALILTCCNKKLNWLPNRVNSWATSLLVISAIYNCMLLALTLLINGTLYVSYGGEVFNFLKWNVYVCMAAPYLIAVFAKFIPYHKLVKEKQTVQPINYQNNQPTTNN